MSTMAMKSPVSVPSRAPRSVAASGATRGTDGRVVRAAERGAVRATESSAVRPTEGSAVRMRLTRRGRIVLAVLAALLAFGIAMVADQAMASGPADPVVHGTVYVAPGDSLWSIASDVAGDRDVRDVIAQIEQLNALTSSEIQVGQELIVPAADG